MNAVRRLGSAAAAAVLAVSVLGSSPAIAKDTSWGKTSVTSDTGQGAKMQPMDTSWGGK